MEPDKTFIVLLGEVCQQMIKAEGKNHLLFGKKNFVEYYVLETGKNLSIDLLFYATNASHKELDKAIIQAREITEADIQIPIIGIPSIVKTLSTAAKFPRLPTIGAKKYPVHLRQVSAIRFYSVLMGERITSITPNEDYNRLACFEIDKFFSSEVLFPTKMDAETKRAEYLSLVERVRRG